MIRVYGQSRASVRRRAAWVGFFGLLAALSVGCVPGSLLITPVSADRSLREFVVSRESPLAARKIALIEVEGTITDRTPASLLGVPGPNPLSVFKEKLDKAAADEAVAAILLRINSPGGGVTASDLMYTELRNFRQRTRKPVVAVMMDVAASGGYYLACAADEIVAHPTTVTGSIGVIMITPDVAGAMQKIGVRANVIKSAEMKDSGSPFRAMSDADRAVFQGIINQMYERFLTVVGESRKGIDAGRLRGIADGRVYLAPEALKLGLVDSIGSIESAVGAAKRLASLGEQPVKLIEYAAAPAHRPNYYAESPAAPVGVNIVNIELPKWLTGEGPAFLYVWSPGL